MNQELPLLKLDLEKAEEPEIILPTSIGLSKKQESSRKTSTLLTMPKPLTVWITTNWKILQEMGITDHLTCLLRNLYAGQKQQLELDMEKQILAPNRERSMSKLYIVTLLM